MVDVGVGDEDLRDAEIVALKDGEDTGDVVAGVNDDGLAGALVTEDGAVALQQADGKDLMDHMRFKVQASRRAGQRRELDANPSTAAGVSPVEGLGGA